jgi:dienelactone hydrolase
MRLKYDENGEAVNSFVQYDPAWMESDEKRPVILVLPDWDGLNSYEEKRAALIVEDLGYVAVRRRWCIGHAW